MTAAHKPDGKLFGRL